MARRTLAIAALLAAACDLNNAPGADAGPDAISPTCLEATTHSDLTWIQDKVFQPSCAGFRDCHQGAAVDAAHLSLERGQSQPQMVGIDSELFPQLKRVIAGDPANSYLMMIIGSYVGPLKDGVGTMPYNSALLCKEKRDAVERWIADGALPEM
ncbi:MAG: hypothetical protein IPL61_00450 [Myxococcales bacterium]|nr:hypothetical protein [Myxococcales bacterium]